MPITQRKNKWYWGSKGPFSSRKKAEEVAQAAHASGYVAKFLKFTKADEGVKGIKGIGDTSSDRPEDDVPKQFREYASLEEIKRLGLRPHTGVEEGTFYDSRDLEAGQHAAATGEKHTIDELREAGDEGKITIDDLGIKFEDSGLATEYNRHRPSGSEQEQHDLNRSGFGLNPVQNRRDMLHAITNRRYDDGTVAGMARRFADNIKMNKHPLRHSAWSGVDRNTTYDSEHYGDWLKAADDKDEWEGAINNAMVRILGRKVDSNELMSDLQGELRANSEQRVTEAQKQLEQLDALQDEIEAFKIQRGINRIGLKRGEKIVSASPENQERAKRFEEENKGLSKEEALTFKSPLGKYLVQTQEYDSLANNYDHVSNALILIQDAHNGVDSDDVFNATNYFLDIAEKGGHSEAAMEKRITPEKLQQFVDEVQRMANYTTRDLPEFVTVYRGNKSEWEKGDPKANEASVKTAERRYSTGQTVPVSVQKHTAKEFATSAGNRRGQLHEFLIHRDDIISDMRSSILREGELLISSDAWKKAIKHSSYKASGVDPKDGTHDQFFIHWDHRDKHRAKINPASPHYSDSYTKEQHHFQGLYLESLEDPKHAFHKLPKNIKDSISETAKLDIKESKKYPWLKAPPKTTEDKDDMGQEKSMDLFKSITVGMLMKDSPFEVSPTGEVKPLSGVEGIPHIELLPTGEEHEATAKIPAKYRVYYQKDKGEKAPPGISQTYVGRDEGTFYDMRQLKGDHLNDRIQKATEALKNKQSKIKPFVDQETQAYSNMEQLRTAPPEQLQYIVQDITMAMKHRYDRATPESDEAKFYLEHMQASLISDASERRKKFGELWIKSYEAYEKALATHQEKEANHLGELLLHRVKAHGLVFQGEEIKIPDSNVTYAPLGSEEFDRVLNAALTQANGGIPFEFSPTRRRADGQPMSKTKLEMTKHRKMVLSSLGAGFLPDLEVMMIPHEQYRSRIVHGDLSDRPRPTPGIAGAPFNLLRRWNNGRETAIQTHMTLDHECLHTLQDHATLGYLSHPARTEITDGTISNMFLNNETLPQEQRGQRVAQKTWDDHFRELIRSNNSNFWAESPVTIISEHVGRRAYNDKVTGTGEINSYPHAYGHSVQEYAHWALAVNGGNATKALKFIKRHNDLTNVDVQALLSAGKQDEVDEWRGKMNTFQLSFATYLAGRAKAFLKMSPRQVVVADGRSRRSSGGISSIGEETSSASITAADEAEGIINRSHGLWHPSLNKDIYVSGDSDSKTGGGVKLKELLAEGNPWLESAMAKLPDSLNLSKQYPFSHRIWQEIPDAKHVAQLVFELENAEGVEKSFASEETLNLLQGIIRKENGGGDGGGGFGGDAGAGTVFTSTNSGIFTPTYGGSSAKRRTSVQRNKKKRKGKKSGIEKLGSWLRDYSPEKKSLSKSTPTDFALDVLLDVSKEYKMKDPKLRNKVDTKLPENETVTNYRPKILDWKKKDDDNAGALTYAKAVDTESSDEVGQITQEQSGYRPATAFEKSQKVQCSSCIFFQEDDNECHLVTGTIEEDAWCHLFNSKNEPKPDADEVVEGEDIEKARDLDDYFSNKHPMQSDKLKRRIIREAVFPRECAGCKVAEWKGSVVPLELNHIDGDHGNNAKENLELLCPNCHALTPHYRVKKPGAKSAIDLHGGAPKGDPRRDKSLDKELRKQLESVSRKYEILAGVMATEYDLEKAETYEEKERNPKFIETDGGEDEVDAAAEQNEFMERLRATTAKHVGDKKDDSDEKAGVMAADADFGAELRLSDDFDKVYQKHEDLRNVLDWLQLPR